MTDWVHNLRQQYQTKIGDPENLGYPKSHWEGCEWGSRNPARRIELPPRAPASLISCNACLQREGYIRILPCNPRMIGWPHSWTKCDKCEYGLDCDTWARVRGVGEDVAVAMGSYHPVTWADIGLVPFHSGDLYFPDKHSLDYFIESLAERYPGHFGFVTTVVCDCAFQDIVDSKSPTDLYAKTQCKSSHCQGFFNEFGFYPASCDRPHTL